MKKSNKMFNSVFGLLRWAVLTGAFLAIASISAQAAYFAGEQTDPNKWTYTLTYEPRDNYAVCPSPGDIATITLSGLQGVVSATAPTSTDFETDYHNNLNLLWSPTVSADGTTVTWRHKGPGTGNFGIDKHVFGFTVITARPAVNGSVDVASDGFSLDVSVSGPCPVVPDDDRDFTGTTNGPVGKDNCGIKYPKPRIRYDHKDAAGRIYIPVVNWTAYPDQMFREAPELPPCGLNTKASRTWVNIFDAATKKRIYGFCALGSNDGLKKIWFMPKTQKGKVYIVLEDRACKKSYKSNTIAWP